MIQFGNDKIKEIYHGSDKIKEVYHGSELVYTAHDPRGYWVHRYTNVKEYFDLSASFINNGIMSQPSWNQLAKEVKIPDGVSGLGDNCLSYGSSITSINIPVGVTSLGEYCFYYCTSLTSITLPESVTSIGNNCFYGCTSLTLATVLPAVPPSIGYGVFNNVHSSFNIKVRSPYVDAYKAATNWRSYSSKISAI